MATDKAQALQAARLRRFVESKRWRDAPEGSWLRWRGVLILVRAEADGQHLGGHASGGRWHWAAVTHPTVHKARVGVFPVVEAIIAARAAARPPEVQDEPFDSEEWDDPDDIDLTDWPDLTAEDEPDPELLRAVIEEDARLEAEIATWDLSDWTTPLPADAPPLPKDDSSAPPER
jgi:hypothetical protein